MMSLARGEEGGVKYILDVSRWGRGEGMFHQEHLA